MKERFLHTHFFLAALFLVSSKSTAQVTLTTSPYIQDFNLIGSGLPTGWTVRTGATASAIGTAATLVTAATSWSSTSGNFRNVASSNNLTSTATSTVQGNSTDRAIAIKQTGTFGDPGAAFALQLSNTSGLSNFSLSFKMLSLDGTSSTGRTTTWKVDYGFGSSPTSFTAVATSPTLLTTTLSVFAGATVTVNFGTALNNVNGNVWIRVVDLSATTGSGSRAISGIDDVSLSFVPSDITPPAFTSGYPNVSNFSTSGFNLFTNLNETGKTYFVVIPDGAPVPSSMQVKNGQDATGALVAPGFSGSINVAVPSTEYSAAISTLNSGTDYDVYVVGEDAVSNLQAAPLKLDAQTNTAGDITPPLFTSTYPVIDVVTPTTFVLRTNLNEHGKTYFVALPSGASAPTSTQVKQGQDAGGNILASNRFGTMSVTSSNTEFTSQVNGLVASTNYDVYIVAEDNVPNLQSSPIKISIVSGLQFTEDFETCDSNAFTSYNVTGAQVWSCVDFGYNQTKGFQMNGFSGGDVANEDWLISPVLTLSANASLSFYSQFSFAGNSLQLKISTDYSGSGDPRAATWTDLNGNFPTVAVSSTSTLNSDWTISNVDLSSYTGQVYIAFVYTSTTSAAARWTIDNITVGNATASYLQILPTVLSFNEPNISKSYLVKGINLQNDVTIIAPNNFQVSKDNSNFSPSISYTAAEAIAQQTVYVNFNVSGIATNAFAGSVLNASQGVATRNVMVTGMDKSQTFNVTTYNMEFFGSNVKDNTGAEFGPTDDALQIQNISAVMQAIGADVFALEEISDDDAFNQLVSNLPGYDMVESDRWSYSWQAPDPHYPPQKTGFIYNTSRVELVSSRVMFAAIYDSILAGTKTLPNYPTGTSNSFWSSGRLPFMATFDVIINGTKRRIRMIDIHAKSGSDQNSYDRRVYDARLLRDSLNVYYPHDNVILLGDFNDDVYGSINIGLQSSYKSFVDDAADFNVLTYELNQSGASTFPSSNSFLDNIIVSDELVSAYVPNSVTIEDARNYINNYCNTTSDHLPVSARFLLSSKTDQTITFNSLVAKIFGVAAFALNGNASSGLLVTYSSSDPTIASINGNYLTVLKTGTVNITASQSGSSDFNAASDVTQALTINKGIQTISFNTLPEKTLGDLPFNTLATTNSSLVVNFSTRSDKITINGAQITLVKSGRVYIRASQSGDVNYDSAASVVQSFCIDPPKPTITLTNTGSSSPALTSNLGYGNQWYWNGNTIAGETNSVLNASNPGKYKVQAQVDDCLSQFSDEQSILITAITKSEEKIMSVYPNPVDDILFISGLNEPVKALLVDIIGQMTSVQLEKDADSYSINVKGLPSGLYILRLDSERKTKSFKFIKK